MAANEGVFISQNEIVAWMDSHPLLGSVKLRRKGRHSTLGNEFVVVKGFWYLEDKFFLKENAAPPRKKRVIVRETLFCNGAGNCRRACGGIGECVQDCTNHVDKNPDHNCSLRVKMRQHSNRVGEWEVFILGEHLPVSLGQWKAPTLNPLVKPQVKRKYCQMFAEGKKTVGALLLAADPTERVTKRQAESFLRTEQKKRLPLSSVPDNEQRPMPDNERRPMPDNKERGRPCLDMSTQTDPLTDSPHLKSADQRPEELELLEGSESLDPTSIGSVESQPSLPACGPFPVMLIGPQEKGLLSRMCPVETTSSEEGVCKSSLQQNLGEEPAVSPVVVKEEPVEDSGDDECCYKEEFVIKPENEGAALPVTVKVVSVEDSQDFAVLPLEVKMEPGTGHVDNLVQVKTEPPDAQTPPCSNIKKV